MDERDKERAFEALLARNLREIPQPSAAECPDADLLAAYLEHSLDDSEREHWERHFAACTQCQHIVAALTRSATAEAGVEGVADVAAELAALRAAVAPAVMAKAAEPQAGAPLHAAAAAMRPTAPLAAPRLETHEPARRFWDWRWLVPAAGLAVVALWIGLGPAFRRTVEIAQRTEPPAAAPETPAPAQEISQPAASSPDASASDKPAVSGETRRNAARLGAVEGEPASRPIPARPSAAPPPAREEHGRVADAIVASKKAPSASSASKDGKLARQEKQSLGGLSGAPGPRKEAAPDAFQVESQRADQAKPAPAPPRPGEPSAQAALVAEQGQKASLEKDQAKNQTAVVTEVGPPSASRELKAKTSAAQLDETKAAGADSRARDTTMLRSSLTGTPWVLVLGPSAVARWRIGPAGAIERWNDETRLWAAQASGVTADLLAGAALSERVCWVAGRDGTVLRTTDGVHWEKLTSPAPVDWVGVTARDATHATLTGPSGLRYATNDGGRNWGALPVR